MCVTSFLHLAIGKIATSSSGPAPTEPSGLRAPRTSASSARRRRVRLSRTSRWAPASRRELYPDWWAALLKVLCQSWQRVFFCSRGEFKLYSRAENNPSRVDSFCVDIGYLKLILDIPISILLYQHTQPLFFFIPEQFSVGNDRSVWKASASSVYQSK